MGNIHYKLPLFIRVVALYVFISVPAWAGWNYIDSANSAPAPQSAIVTSIATPAPTPEVEAPEIIFGEPTRVQVPRLGIDLTITDGFYDSSQDEWTLTDDKAQFARMTELPNNRAGNTFVYGHNTDQVFAKLSGLQAGDSAIISTSNGHAFTYTFNGNQIVDPTDTSILATTVKPQLTLMTCEGIFDQTRRVMFFDLKEVS